MTNSVDMRNTSVSLENTPLVKFTRNHIGDPSGVLSLVKALMMSFPAFSQLFAQTATSLSPLPPWAEERDPGDEIVVYANCQFV